MLKEKKNSERVFVSIVWVSHAQWAYHLNRLLTPIIGSRLALTDQDSYFVDVAQERISERVAHGGNSNDMLGQMLTTQKSKPHFKNSHIKHMIAINVLVGSDTTGTALSAVFWLLLTHPETFKRLRAELDEVRASIKTADNKNGSRGDDRVWTFATAERCSYLQAVMYESLRLFPPAPGTLDRVVPEGGMTIGSHYVPAGVSGFSSPCSLVLFLQSSSILSSTCKTDCTEFLLHADIVNATDYRRYGSLCATAETRALGPRCRQVSSGALARERGRVGAP